MATVSGFLRLDNRFIITGQLKPSTGMHVGGGAVSASSDSPFFRDEAGPLVPGSSLRGVLRSRLERILQAIGGNRGCVLFTRDTHPTCFTVNDGRLADWKRKNAGKSSAERERLLEFALLSGDGQCDICRLFGSPLLASKLQVSDARPSNPRMQVRDGVGIDRDTETAREHIKYDFETMETSELGLRMEIENATDTDLALLGIVLREMRDAGIDVGGKKSRGLGRCTLTGDLTVSGFADAAGLKRFLATGACEKVTGFELKVERCLKAYLGVSDHAAPSKE